MGTNNIFSICSMTGQAQSSLSNELGEINVQIKSLNHRFRDVKFRAPSFLSMAEIKIRKILETHFKRGSFDVIISVKFHDDANAQANVNLDKVKKYLSQFDALNLKEKVQIDLLSFLRPEFAIDMPQEQTLKIMENLDTCFSKACQELSLQRQEEGEKIRLLIIKYHAQLLVHLDIIKSLQFNSLEIKKNKLKQRLSEIAAEQVDGQRLAQEFVYLAQKLDIQEEIDRFSFHWTKLEKLISDKYNKADRGKELEFILQEMGREVNTLGNKADYPEISNECVALKVILENIREQILNIE